MKSSTDVGQLGLALNRRLIPEIFDGVEVRALQASEVPLHKLDKPFLHGPYFVHMDIAESNVPSPLTVATK